MKMDPLDCQPLQGGPTQDAPPTVPDMLDMLMVITCGLWGWPQPPVSLGSVMGGELDRRREVKALDRTVGWDGEGTSPTKVPLGSSNHFQPWELSQQSGGGGSIYHLPLVLGDSIVPTSGAEAGE